MELAWDQPFPRVNCVPQFPMPESCNLCKAHGVPVARQEQGHCQHPADSAALEILQHCQNHPQAALEKKGSITASALQKEKQREDIGAASKFRADPPGFLTRRHFSWEHAIPHILLMFPPQRTRILHFSAWETSFSEVACLLSLRTGRDCGYFELKKALLFLCAAPPLLSLSACLSVSLSLSPSHFSSDSYFLNAAQYRNSSSA